MTSRPRRGAVGAAVVVAVVVAAIVVPLALSGGTQVKTVRTAAPSPVPARAGQCGPLPLRAGQVPPGLTPQDRGTQPVGVGQTVVLVQGAAGRVDLARGVEPQVFSVSLYSHGSVPLQTVTVLGQQATLFPPGAGTVGPRLPLTYPAGGTADLCDRFQLQGVGVSSSELQMVAQGLVPASTSP